MTTTNQAEKFCSLNLMLFPALLICICRLKLLGIECLRPFWALGIRKRCGGATFPVGAPLFHRRSLLLVLSTWDKRCGGATLLRWSAARQSCHSCFSACALLRQQCASLLLTSFKAVCCWPASKCEQAPVLLGGSSSFELMGDRWWELGWSCELFQTSEPLNGDLPSWPQGSRYALDDCSGIGIMTLLWITRKYCNSRNNWLIQ